MASSGLKIEEGSEFYKKIQSRIRESSSQKSVVKKKRSVPQNKGHKVPKEGSIPWKIYQGCIERGIEPPTSEFYFHPDREFRMDLAWPDQKVAVEYQGIGRSGNRYKMGGHQTLTGYSHDCEKLNEAVLLGWKVIKVTTLHLNDGKVYEWIKKYLQKFDVSY